MPFGKKGFKYFIGYKDTKKINLHVNFFQKWQHIEKTLMKLTIRLFRKKMMNYYKNTMKFGSMNLIVS